MRSPKISLAAAGLLAVTTLALSGTGAGAATLLGESQPMGKGQLRTYVETDAEDKPVAIGVLFGADALDGLPPHRNATSRCFDLSGNGRIDGADECEGDLEFALSLPEEIAGREDIPFRWVGVNWNAEGHPPASWSVPHFDFHFYIASREEVAGIRVGPCNFFIHCDDLMAATKPVPDKYVAPDHVNVDAAVSMMGNHLIDARTPELADPPRQDFTHTWIFGAYDGHITFYEPMITLAFFRSRPDVCTAIRQPAAWERAGYYPTEYCIRYHPDDDAYTVSLEGFVERAAE